MKKYGFILLTLIIIPILFVSTAFTLPFSNGSFEDGSIDPNTSSPYWIDLGVGSTVIESWTIVSGTIDYVGSNYWAASDGNRSLDLGGYSDGTISQTFDATSGVEYIVRFDMAGNPAANPIKRMRVSVDGFSGEYQFDQTGWDWTNMGWVTYTFTFIADDSQATLIFENLTGDSCGAALDNVRVEASGASPVPEPSTMLLLGSGLIGLATLRRRFRKA
jgi:choice-of-anchor C domain-containing protein